MFGNNGSASGHFGDVPRKFFFGSTTPHFGANPSLFGQPFQGGSSGFSLTPASSGSTGFSFGLDTANSTSAPSGTRYSGASGFSFGTGSSRFLPGKEFQSSQGTANSLFGNPAPTTATAGSFGAHGFTCSTSSPRPFSFGMDSQSDRSSNRFGFGLNSAPGGLFGAKPFSIHGSSLFGSSAPSGLFGSSLFGSSTTSGLGTSSSSSSGGNFCSSKPGVGQFGGFSFGSGPSTKSSESTFTFGASATPGSFGATGGFGSAFGTNTQPVRNPLFGFSTTPGSGNSGSTTTGFGFPFAPPVSGTTSQTAQNSFTFGRSSAQSSKTFGSTATSYVSPFTSHVLTQPAQSPFTFGRTSTQSFPSFGSSTTGYASPFTSSVFTVKTQPTEGPFTFGRTSTQSFPSFGSSTTGCASAMPSFLFGTNTSSAPSSNSFGSNSKPSFAQYVASFTRDGCSNAPRGTTIKFKPNTGVDTMVKSGVTTDVTVRMQCITTMGEYMNKSLEELRFEDYEAGRRGLQTNISTCDNTTEQYGSLMNINKKPGGPSISIALGNPAHGKSSSAGIGDAVNDLIKGMVTNLNLPPDQKVVVFSVGTIIINKGSGGMDMMEESTSLNINTQDRCITCMKECEHKSVGQRVEDGSYNRRQLCPRPSFKGFSSTRRQALFAKRRGVTTSSTFGSTTNWKTSFGAHVSATPNGTASRFFPPTATETVTKPSETANVRVRYQCISCMKEYENKSLEELRTEDYAANRKGEHLFLKCHGTKLKGCCST